MVGGRAWGNDQFPSDLLVRQARTDQAGRTTLFEYDAGGRLTQVTDALGGLTRYTYDESGSRLTQTDANDHTTSYAYDNMGRLVRRTLPLGMSQAFT